MISRGREIFFSNLWKPKNIHSLEYLRYLYTTLNKNLNITENNKELLVEVFRLIAEIIIWGDQNDSSIIEFFLEKNIMSLFLKFMNQPNGKLIHKQLLQTLSIMFENISNKGSIYYLLSNNHINAIIRYEFDFKDEEVMAYYISFLKALSLKLNKHTIHFFYNEHINDFALFNESIRFFDQPESMVRTSVRNITLNIFKVVDKAMIRYVSEKIADQYFNSLMWFIGNRILNIDIIIKNDSTSPHFFSRLQCLVHEHLDHLHYINDILCLNVEDLNEVLMSSLLYRLYLPLCICPLYKLPCSTNENQRPLISHAISLFLLAQVFILIKHKQVVNSIASIIFTGRVHVNNMEVSNLSLEFNVKTSVFEAPSIGLEESLNKIKEKSQSKDFKLKVTENFKNDSINHFTKLHINSKYENVGNSAPVTPRHRYYSDHFNINEPFTKHNWSLAYQPFITSDRENIPCMKTILQSFDLTDDKLDDDYNALLAMCLLFAIFNNEGVDESLLISFGFKPKEMTKYEYNSSLMDKLINIFNSSVKYGSTIRLITLQLACVLVETLVCSDNQCWISDEHFAYILTSYEESKLLLRNYYKSEDIFADMFEDEHMNLQKQPFNVEYLLNDSAILLSTKINSSLDFVFRLPLNDVERARYSIRVFLLLRQLCDQLKVEEDNSSTSWDSTCITYSCNQKDISLSDKLDLSNRDWIACTVDHNGKIERQFLIIDEQQIILVEPDSELVGIGIVRFIGFIRNLQFTGSKDDNRCLLINLYSQSVLQNQLSSSIKAEMLTFEAKLMFDDHIRCVIAQKRFEKCQEVAHELKLQQIALMLDFPRNVALGIKSSTSNIEKEYRSGYFGPQKHIFKNIAKENNLEKLNSMFSTVQSHEGTITDSTSSSLDNDEIPLE